MKTVFTGFGVILAISASRSFAPASVCLASTTITLVLPMMIVLLPPDPPRPAQTSGFSIFMLIGGGACCAMVETEREPHNSTAIPRQRIFEFDIVICPFVKRNSTTAQAVGANLVAISRGHLQHLQVHLHLAGLPSHLQEHPSG